MKFFQLSPGEYFIATVKIAFYTGILLTSPFLLSQLTFFVIPGLNAGEKRLILPLLISSSFLFYLGVLFAYFIVFPILFSFLTATAPDGIKIMTDINHYLNFILKLFFAFGVSFEIPIATILLIRTNFISAEKLSSNRPYVIFFAFLIGMLLTPPDVISQILLAIPVWLLFEIGLIISKYFKI